MAGWGDEVKEDVDTVVAESGVTLDAGLFCEDVVVLSLKVTNYFREAAFVSMFGSWS